MPQAARTLRQAFVTGVVLYSLGTSLLSLLWFTLGQAPWWLAVAAIFAPFWFAPLVFLVPLALFVRSSWLRGATLLMLALFLLLFGSWLVPKAPPVGEANLRLVSFNHLYHNEESGRRGSHNPRPPTPPGIRFRTTAVHEARWNR